MQVPVISMLLNSQLHVGFHRKPALYKRRGIPLKSWQSKCLTGILFMLSLAELTIAAPDFFWYQVEGITNYNDTLGLQSLHPGQMDTLFFGPAVQACLNGSHNVWHIPPVVEMIPPRTSHARWTGPTSHCLGMLLRPRTGALRQFRRQAQPLVGIAEPRTAPRHSLRQRHELCLRRVVLDVSLRPRLMLAVAHVGIPLPFLPELPLAPQHLVRLLGRVTLPGIHQPPHGHGLHAKEQMDMIRHYHPGAEVVFHPVTKSQRPFHQLGHLRPAEMTLPSPPIEIRLEFQCAVCGRPRSRATPPTPNATPPGTHPPSGT